MTALLRFLRAAPALLLLLVACGDDDRATSGGTPDMMADSAADDGVDDLATDEGPDIPVDEGTQDKGIDPAQFGTDIDDAVCPDIDAQGELPLLIITQAVISDNVATDTNTGVEVYNPRAEPLDLAETPIWLSSRPADVELSTISDDDTIIEPGEFRFFRFTPMFDTEVDRRKILEPFDGELGLYIDDRFGNRDNMIDFVCWGDTPDPEDSTYYGAATSSGVTSGFPLWIGPCAPELDEVNLTIRRRYGREGNCGNDYEAAQLFVPRDCSVAE